MNSRNKGKGGELEIARYFRAQGYDAHRGQQYHGGPDSPDVVGVPYLHIEVKRRERLELYDAVAQAKRDAGPGDVPVVLHRRNACEWLAIMPLDEFMKLYKAYEAERAESEKVTE